MAALGILSHMVAFIEMYSDALFHSVEDITQLATTLLACCYILCSKECNAAKRARFRQLVAGLSQRWADVMGEARPICVHIMEAHWPAWMDIITAYFLRTEGGERLNSTHSRIFGTRTTQWTPMVKGGEVCVQSLLQWQWQFKHCITVLFCFVLFCFLFNCSQ